MLTGLYTILYDVWDMNNGWKSFPQDWMSVYMAGLNLHQYSTAAGVRFMNHKGETKS